MRSDWYRPDSAVGALNGVRYRLLAYPLRPTGGTVNHVLVAVATWDRERGGGAVRLAYDLAQGLVERGIRVSVLCEDVYEQGPGPDLVDGVQVLRYRISRSRGSGLQRHTAHIRAATRALRSLPEAPDVVHGHSLFQYVAALRVFKERARCCYTVHSPFVEELPIVWGAQGLRGRIKRTFGLPVIRQLEQEVLSGSAAVVAESDFTRSLIHAQYGADIAARFIVIPGWIDPERFRPLDDAKRSEARNRLGWTNDPTFFVLRRLEARMGLDTLLHALRLVRTGGHLVQTYVGGSGSQLDALWRLRDSLGLASTVHFMGFVSGEVLPSAYAACDASVIPTAQLEGFGIIALEALACGRPALVTPVGALPEVMQQFEPGWIARSSSAEDLADLLGRYLAGALPRPHAAALRRTIGERFTLEHALDRYLDEVFRQGEGAGCTAHRRALPAH